MTDMWIVTMYLTPFVALWAVFFLAEVGLYLASKS